MRQALEAVPAPMILIAGGRDKGNNYATVSHLIERKVCLLIATGESREKLASFFKGKVPVIAVPTIDEAVAIAHKQAKAGESVLFSPACASFDMFNNFEERGAFFKQCVRQVL